MIGVSMYITIKSLWEKHKNKRVKEIEAGKEYLAKKPHPRILDYHKKQILEWLEENLSGVRIHEKIQEEGLKVGYSTVKDYICQIKSALIKIIN
jgi:hypothetical protein